MLIITKTECKTRIKGHQDGKEAENENVHGDAIDNTNDDLIQTGKSEHNWKLVLNCTYC
jgi:hypothetical protein